MSVATIAAMNPDEQGDPQSVEAAVGDVASEAVESCGMGERRRLVDAG
jgi:hypothetical protein